MWSQFIEDWASTRSDASGAEQKSTETDDSNNK